MTKETKAPTFDAIAFNDAMQSFITLKETHKEKRDSFRIAEGKAELSLLVTAVTYGAETFDLQPLAQFVAKAKPSAIAKRAIKAIFPSHEFALVGEKKRPAFVLDETLGKVFSQDLLQVIVNCAESGEAITCDQIKKAFPEKDLAKAEKLEKLGKSLAARMKADGLTKADIAEILKGL